MGDLLTPPNLDAGDAFTPEIRARAQAVLDVHIRNEHGDFCALCKVGNWPCAAFKLAHIASVAASVIDQTDLERREWERVTKDVGDAAKVANERADAVMIAVGRALGYYDRVDADTLIADLNAMPVCPPELLAAT